MLGNRMAANECGINWPSLNVMSATTWRYHISKIVAATQGTQLGVRCELYVLQTRKSGNPDFFELPMVLASFDTDLWIIVGSRHQLAFEPGWTPSTNSVPLINTIPWRARILQHSDRQTESRRKRNARTPARTRHPEPWWLGFAHLGVVLRVGKTKPNNRRSGRGQTNPHPRE